MLNRLRGLLVPLVVLSLAVGGLAYAAVDDDSPVDVVQDTAEEAPETVVDDAVVQDDEPTQSPESDDDVTTTDDGTPDGGIIDDVADEAAPVADEEGSHGPERSTEGCPEGFSGNHGQYVSGTEERPRSDAAHSSCGKPVHEGKDKTAGDDDTGDTAPEDEGS